MSLSVSRSQPPPWSVGIVICFIAMIACIPAANWFLHNVGTFNGPGAPRTVDFLGLSAPSGVLFAGLSFTFRDLLQTMAGVPAVIVAIFVGAILSAFVSPDLAFASAAAFAVAELFDSAVFSWLRERSLGLALVASNVIAAAADSAVFLWIAFGFSSVTEFGADQFVVKLAASLIVGYPILRIMRARRRKLLVESI